ncbi:MAG: dihydrodipicolinate synthase family protein [Gemmobacter sp.]|nr:dihydrodipicolinate synthase family protein [Gemmobacter sp.]
MARSLAGVHAATVCPMDSAGRIVEDELADHILTVSSSRGIRGLLINGHAGEGHLLSPAERRLVADITRKTVPPTCFVTAGITSESTTQAVQEAVDATDAGADAILIFPPNHWAGGVDARIATDHHRAIAEASGLPVVLYKAPVKSGSMSYTTEILSALLDLEPVLGIKEGSWEVATYEATWRLCKTLRPDVTVMGSGDEHLLTSFIIGSDGSQVSLAAIIPDIVTDLFDAAAKGDWEAARACHEALYPLSVAIYRHAPQFLATARLKTCLKLLGRISCDRVKAPMRQLYPEEVAHLRLALGL